MKALEDTTKQHYMYYFDPEYVTEMRTPGFDPHLSIAEFGGLLTKEQVLRFKELKDKEQNEEEKLEFSKLNKQRNIAKVLNFSCLPVDNTEILTPKGYKTFYDLSVGDDIISYNTEKDCLEITQITEIPYYKNAEVVNLNNKRFNFECTSNHRWFTKKRSKLSNNKYWWSKQFVETKDLISKDSIITSSKYLNENTIYLDQDVELLGWLLTKGSWKWLNRVTKFSNKKCLTVTIKIRDDVRELERVLEPYPYDTYERTDGLTYYYLKSKKLKKVFKKFNISELSKDEIDYTSIIFNMSFKQRELFIQAMLKNNRKYGGNRLCILNQSKGNVLDAFCLAITLNGYSYSLKRTEGKNEERYYVHLYENNFISCQELKRPNLRYTEVFCVNNKNQTFIAKQNGRAVITGNSVYGAGAKKISESIGIDFEVAKKLHTAYWERNKAVKDFAKSVKIKVFFKNGEIKQYKSEKLLALNFQEQEIFNDQVEVLWVQNPVSKYWLYLRSLKDIFSAINQNTGVYCFDLYYKEVKKYFNIIFQYHDK